ncbi:uncharacterized protein GGS25DRAFT_422360 [Hypoxylon fragiforme]|uniref:uncharacterized protein n=1 Tax=Hypoxylon fragiforme TaxID=63214 RepID=UPI0020C70DF6|nr:uncharacterized protein GGS25DRAFT_422360 [Hypoxylon fragiforme]KAI2605248.1 hypothetical protein GGS25DRAFT_422360 [Hypoxylon fragiforme]
MSTTTTTTKLASLARWARLKKYRIEVTYGVYVFTPAEKFVFWTVFCLLFTAISFAAFLFTRRNVLLLVRYYAAWYVGGNGGGGGITGGAISSGMMRNSDALGEGVASLAERMGGAANSQGP